MKEMRPDLSPLLSEYFAAANTDDADRIAACFAEDAKVHDEKQDFAGRAAIRQWAIEARKKASFRSEPFEREGEPDAPIVRAHVTGNFPGSPVDLTYRFTLANGKIATLSIR
jgi:ketosteroid isomerase-like protein